MKNKPRVEGRMAELIVPHREIVHRDVELVFVYPSFGPHNYRTIGKKILEKGLSIPTGYQTASLLYGAYNSSELEFRGVQDIIDNNMLWVFNRNLWTHEGVYVAHDPEAIGISWALDRDELEERLRSGREVDGVRFSEDRSVSFAPKESYKLGDHTPESLSKDGFMVASFGPEGAEKIGEVVSKFGCKPQTGGTNLIKGSKSEYSPEYSVSILRNCTCAGESKLYFEGYFGLDGDYGCAYGVQKTGGTSASENGV